MATLNINNKNFILGESQTDAISDRGFSPDSVNLNLTKERGKLYFAEAPTNRGGATLTGNIIATANDSNYLGNDKYFVDDEGAFYTLSGSTFTKQQTSASTFVLGTSDIIQFKLVTYATSTDSLHEFTGSDLDTSQRLWGGAFDATFRHPMEVVEKELFIGDKNLIHFFDGTTSGTAFTLPTNVNVTSLRKHPDGKTLLAFTGTTGDLNGARTRSGVGKVYYCQPTLRGAAIEGWTREVEIESQVEGTRVVGGTVYTTWGKNFGVFDGNGLVKLKELETSIVTYSHNISNMDDILTIRDGLNVKAFGDLGAGRVWWNMYQNTTNSNEINNISYKGDNKLLVAFKGASAGTGLLQEIDYDNAGVNGAFYTNRIDVGSEIHTNRIDVVHDESGPAGTTTFILQHRDTEDNEKLVETRTYINKTARKSRFKTDVKDDISQFKITPSQDNIGYRSIRIQYEPLR